MFSDTHCHIFSKFDEQELQKLAKKMADEKYRFVLDIGTEAGDLQRRKNAAKDAFSTMPDFVHFSAGIWPDKQSIKNPEPALRLLEADIKTALKEGAEFFALGECGLDRYWNGENGVKDEDGNAIGAIDTGAEEFLFEKQIEMARKFGLPMIIHSRDAFEETIYCMDKGAYHHGVMHCYSYGEEELFEFTKRGWYISLSGTCTFPKTNIKKEKTASLIRSIPYDKLLLETDAPFLTPSPHRGKVNTPLYIRHTYELVAGVLGCSIEELCLQVYNNATKLFKF
ncbi:MAG: deoxyribonuclease [Treponema sp.]|nr:MAG: deoxyribonuclease [Treponema sp.]